MPDISYRISFTPTPGASATRLDYRLSTSPVWITPTAPVNPTTLPYYDLALTPGNNYDVRLSALGSCSPRYTYLSIIVPLGGNCCPAGYSLSPDGTYCVRELVSSPTIVQSDICFATSQLAGQYSSGGAKIYDPGYDAHLSASSTFTSLLGPEWQEVPGGLSGPMNRNGIWVDTNCDGVKDVLSSGQVLQITATINLTAPQTLYVGIGGDNTFKIDLNGTTVVDCSNTFPAGGHPSDNFNFWHLIPIVFPSGTSYLTMSGVGDGSTNDCFAAVVYDNSSTELSAATDDTTLNILFQSVDLRGGHLDIATCPSGYFLDTSGGTGHYQCKKIETTPSTPC
jgi:hypothetical protein